MIQSHLLQIMALLAIEPPATIGERDLRDAVAAVLRASSIKPPYTDSTRRARYLAGSLGGKDVPDYAAEEGVDPDRNTETLAEVRVDIDNLALEGRAVHPPFRQGPRDQAQGSGGHLPPVPHLPAGFTAGTRPTRSGSASARTPWSSTSTSTAPVTFSASTAQRSWPSSTPPSCCPTAKCWKAS
jgi:glucose-6-phosphate 1-dehydrogenase